MIPQETVQTILDTAQIVDVVSDFVALKRRGTNWRSEEHTSELQSRE